MKRPWIALLVTVVATALTSPPVDADASHDVATVFFVSKSENRNQVHYSVRLDDRCAPVGPAPVLPYWRMLERDSHAIEPLLAREIPAYGIVEQTIVSRGGRGGVVRVVLRALPSRPLVVTTYPIGEATCKSTASLVISGIPAALTSLHVQLKWPWGVEYILVNGRALSDGHPVTERIVP